MRARIVFDSVPAQVMPKILARTWTVQQEAGVSVYDAAWCEVKCEGPGHFGVRTPLLTAYQIAQIAEEASWQEGVEPVCGLTAR